MVFIDYIRESRIENRPIRTMKQIAMRPQDIVILLKKIAPGGWIMNGKQLSESVGISQSEVSEALARCKVSGLIDPSSNRVNALALKDFLVFGLKYAFPIVPAGVVKGVPTYVSASPIKERIVQSSEVFVWPDNKGSLRGQAIQPLYPSVPSAIEKDSDFYALLVVADTLRMGRVREREIAIEILDHYILNYAKQQRKTETDCGSFG